MRKFSRGFTIVELLVVIAVIGLLSAISLVSFNRYQATSRDAQRAARTTVIAEALEKYYDKNGEYPSCAAITGSASSVLSTLVGIQTDVLVTPQNSSGDNSIKCQDLQASDPDIFAYVGDGSGTCTTGTSCLQYTLKYREESTGDIKSIESRHRTDFATSGIITDLTANLASQGFQTVRLDWTTVSNAASYSVQRGPSDCSFSTFTDVLPSPTTNTIDVTGLTPGTSYCFRVAPVSNGIASAWSNTDTATTRQLTTPAIATANNDIGAITVSWTDISYEQSYVLEYTTVNGTWSNTPITLAANTVSRTVTGLTPGSTYYFRLQALATGTPADQDTSNYSTVVSRVAPELGTPTLTVTNTPDSLTATWSAITYRDTYRLIYNSTGAVDGNGVLTSATVVNGTATTYTITGLSPGITRYFQVRAEQTSDIGNYSTVESDITTVPISSTPSIAYVTTNGAGSTTSSATCSLGAVEYSRATTYQTSGSTADNYGAWTAWQASGSFGNFITTEGMFGKAKVRTKCVYSGFDSATVESSAISNIRSIPTRSTSTAVTKSTATAQITVYGSCASGTSMTYLYGRIYHGSAGTNAGGGSGAGSGFIINNTGWSYSDGINVYRVSRVICQTPYWESGTYSGVPGGTLQNCCGATGLTDYNNFVGAGYSFNRAR